jgi:beta-lactamase regulating signal transducer with metallopeptidase domain/ketosteroid isomerase-like protein
MSFPTTVAALFNEMQGGAWMIVDSSLKATILIVLIGLVTSFCQKVSAAYRHLVWSLTIGMILFLPLLNQALPAWRISPLPAMTSTTTTDIIAKGTGSVESILSNEFQADTETLRNPAAMPSATSASPPVAPQASSKLVFLIVSYTAGLLGLALFLLIGHLRLRRIVGSAQTVSDPSTIRITAELKSELDLTPQSIPVLSTTESISPMTLGLMRPKILLPASYLNWDESRKRDVLIHELSHIRRRDSLTQALANLVCLLHWFNPFVWFAARKMLSEREHACDDQVLLRGTKASSYAHNLLEIARSFGADYRTAQISMAMARRSQIAGRMLAVLDPDLKRIAPGRSASVVTAIALLIVVLPLAAVSPGHSADLVAAAIDTSPVLEVQGGEAMSLSVIRGEIEQINDEFETLIRRGDLEDVVKLFAYDAVMYPMSSRPVKGRRAILRLIEQVYDSNRYLSFTEQQIERVGDLVYEIGSFEVGVSRRSPTLVGRYTTIWIHRDGRWQIYRDISNI